ncbi:zinc finger CCHC domain-containing protein 7 [Oryzias melastigma]|uniref:zinc finger CCHC domain-containing protein 7 n=1 Tax=Oryzias melastigma TaxID=30732 RepID=UPI000CF82F9A|nr:zinc finger CCHC domain-containing protein 7 [Oryzias melastigma]
MTYRTVRQSGRYFTEKTFYCGNCSMMGHLSRSCPDSKLKPCFICGALGHLGDKCPNNYCSNCYQPGHTSKTCSEIPCGKKQCQRCGMKGHFSDGCPEIWRQYHHTTKNAPPVPKQAEDKGQSSAYCYNCAEKGHYGHACTKPRMSEGVFVHVPYINHYDTLEEIQRRQEERKGKAQKMQEIPASSTPPAQPVFEGKRRLPKSRKAKKEGEKEEKK